MFMRRIFRLKKKLFMLVLIIFLATIFIGYLLLTPYYLGESKPELVNDFNIIPRHEWTLNTDILQYSSIIIVDKEELIVEALLFLNNLKEDVIYKNKNSTKCLILNEQKQLKASVVFKILKIPLMNVPGMSPVGLWKIKCKFKISKKEDSYKDFKVAIINSDHFKNDEYSDIFHNSSAIFPSNLIKYQNPTIYYSNKRKKPAIANCVHLVRNLKADRLERLLKWLEIQFSIGMKHITFYFFEPNELAKRLIEEKYSSDKVVIVDYQTSKSQVCKSELEMIKLHSPNSKQYKHLYEVCENSFEKHFNMSKGYTMNAHERLNTNDCYMHYRNEYEFVTNMDFDELFFPRQHETRSVSNINDTKNYCLSKPNHPDIYEYAKRMFVKHGFRSASLSFEHVLFINVSVEFFNSLFETQNDRFKAEIKNNRSLFFDVFPKDKSYLNYLLDAKNAFACLNSKYRKSESVWNNAYATLMNNRDGKSIYKSEYTEAINQHFATSILPSTKKTSIPLADGFSSHFREYTGNFFFNQHISINNFFVDIEYYKYFISFQNDIN